MEHSDVENSSLNEIIVYKKRFVIAFLMSLICMLSVVPLSEYASITNVIAHFYKVDNYFVNLLSISYPIVYLIGFMPINWIALNYGIRVNVTICSFTAAIGAILKYVAIEQGLFWISLVGQIFSAISGIYTYSCAPQIANVWFPVTETTSVISILVIANYFGIASGMLIPPLLVGNVNLENLDLITTRLRFFMLAQSILGVFLFIAMLFGFDEKPRTPPSFAQQAANEHQNMASLFSTLKALICNRNFVLLVISSGIIMAISNSNSTVLNQLVLSEFSNQGETYLVTWIHYKEIC
ncbi:feline leukemia virus subgroup C receptor-related protein 2-like isoform X2 [Dinothrombium tinctorium]|uniref:Feline leukemia virus subgroup C receptor-related protein 2-like isoform X2 n=1 Tax=Dinothrombium tinctorium TaxID=1965070 RepID=A0A3S3PFP1_9ACAR|nr:feline leukemia virus subgroup C receptor-related protein 2-like isoform X2 [Dinothrombium tinctorium]